MIRYIQAYPYSSSIQHMYSPFVDPLHLACANLLPSLLHPFIVLCSNPEPLHLGCACLLPSLLIPSLSSAALPYSPFLGPFAPWLCHFFCQPLPLFKCALPHSHLSLQQSNVISMVPPPQVQWKVAGSLFVVYATQTMSFPSCGPGAR